ncbi:MAG TPA: DUF2071 domain-containing protein [Candidatus Poseidoniaceae archaeon]|nr:DUF2071 domain-containing protein [Candidatus Poseidoniaceae archaeon]
MAHQFRDDHLPFPMPIRKHALTQSWKNLSFLHWEVEPEKLTQHLPDGLELDLFNGKAYVGTIPFEMKHVRPRWFFSVPGISNFPEFNVRTYVTKDGKPGVFFLTLDAQSRITCFHAPRSYGLPYRYAKCKVRTVSDQYTWSSKRKFDGAMLKGNCRAIGDAKSAKQGSLEYFLFERYCLYTSHREKLHRAYTQHDPWIYKTGEVTIEENTLTESYNLGIDNLKQPDHIHMSRGVKVRTWSIEPL